MASKKIDSTSVDINRIDHDTQLLNAVSNRRKALVKIGKFSAYAVPTAFAIISSKPASASVGDTPA